MPLSEDADEHTPLVPQNAEIRRRSGIQPIADSESHISQEEHLLAETAVGERLPYNDYTTIDWLHDLVKDSYRYRTIHSRPGLRYKLLSHWDRVQGWVIAATIGTLTACIAFIVDMAAATVSDWKTGYCISNPLSSKEMCCTPKKPLHSGDPAIWPFAEASQNCAAWHPWTTDYWAAFAIYLSWALLLGIMSGAVTMLTKAKLPAASPGSGDKFSSERKKLNGAVNGDSSSLAGVPSSVTTGKSMYMAAGSGIPEIKTILSGFVIPDFLTFKVLLVKAVGSVFAVSTGMCLGKEGPFVHISTCVAYLVGCRFPKYSQNSRNLRELLSAGCASGLSVAFGAPIGGVLFAYEEISTYFPRKVLWRAFICSLFAAMTLRALNPTGTGKLVLFETNYGTSYNPYHYVVFVLLGIAGGVFGGLFCKMNFLWSRTFRKFNVIKNHPVFEVFLVVAVTALTQYPNPLTREPGDVIIKSLLVDCSNAEDAAYVCVHEAGGQVDKRYLGWLIHGALIKLVLTIITFGIKVPSGVIIPALDGGAFFGRLIGQLPFLHSTISPGIFAMVGAGAFLAGVSRMTISLAVIMFELTGELEFIVPNMIGIMVAKWVADALEKEGVYDLAQTVLGHPFLDLDQSISLVREKSHLVSELIPPEHTMLQITVDVPPSGCVQRGVLAKKLDQLKARGLMDAGLVLIQHSQLLGYLSEGELDFALSHVGDNIADATQQIRVVQTQGADHGVDYVDLSTFVDQTPLTVCATAPMEYAVEMFGKLGLRYLIITEQGSGKVVGVIIKKRLVTWLDGLKHER